MGVWDGIKMVQFTQPLDLQNILQNYLAGDSDIFAGMALVLIAVLAARFRMPNSLTLSFFVLFAIIFRQSFPNLYFLGLFLMAIVTFYALGSIWKR